MSNTWLTADNHFSHANIIRYENRPFADIDEMNEAMIANWNEYVKPGDTIYHLGDVFFGPKDTHQAIFDRLNGDKILLMGNHDHRTSGSYREMGFKEAYKVNKGSINRFGLLLSHYPIENTTELNVHGHVHSQIQDLDQSIYKCVSVELTNYRPVHLDEILDWARSIRGN